MSVREYIGARYVPVFADPLQWDPTLKYEPLTVVTNEGASYVSRRYVPEGIQLSNTDYWVLWADFNAQLQHYIDDVETFDGRIDNLEDALPIADFTSQSTVSDALDALKGKFPIATADIADSAITSSKIADSAITSSKIANVSITPAKMAPQTLKRSFSGANVIWVGDSWCVESTNYGVTTPHPMRVAAHLKFGNLYSSFRGSRGYCRENTQDNRPKYLTSLQTLAADTSFDNDSIDYVIIEGSINDATFTYEQIVLAMETCISYAKSTFSKAEVIIIPTMGNNTHTIDWELCARANRAGAMRTYATYIRGGHWLLYGIDGMWNDDNVHPNQYGQDYIASALCVGLVYGNMNCALYGVTPSATKLSALTNFTSVNSSGGYYNVTQREVKLVENALYFVGTIVANPNSNATCPFTSTTEIWTCDIENMCMDSKYMKSKNDLTGVETMSMFNKLTHNGFFTGQIGYDPEVGKIRIFCDSTLSQTQSGTARICVLLGFVAIGIDD